MFFGHRTLRTGAGSDLRTSFRDASSTMQVSKRGQQPVVYSAMMLMNYNAA